jgi:hypothetical protein
VTAFVPLDRGLGTAYERYCFYQRLDEWAREFEVGSMLEGPLDGMAGVAGVHGVGLARAGISVVAAVDTEEKAAVARRIYAASAPAGAAEVRVVSVSGIEALPQADLVLAYHAVPDVPDWRGYIHALAAKARKALVVTVCNPDNWGVAILRSVAKVRRASGMEPPSTWYTSTLAPALWEVGRVKHHVYFDCPWWPDLQVSPGQTLFDRARKLWSSKQLDFTSKGAGDELAERFVYGPERWPYFGGPGWTDELLPALLRHPCFDGASDRVAKRAAHLHAFVVDMRPRTPRERRRLARAPAP